MDMRTTQGLRFAIYARVSTEQQAEDGESLSAQVERLKTHVRQLGGVVTEVFSQQEHATEGYDRRSLYSLLRSAKEGVFNAVIVRDQSRWSRDPVVGNQALVDLRKQRIRFFVGMSELDLMSPEGQLQYQIANVIDQYQAQKMRYASAESRLQRANRGWPNGGPPPFARKLANDTPANRASTTAEWVLDEDKHQVVLRMYELLRQGKMFSEIAIDVGMHAATVSRILIKSSGPIWVREFKDSMTDQKTIIETSVPPLLTPEQIEVVQARARENQMERSNWSKYVREYPLAHLTRCHNPACGWSNLSGHSSRQGGATFAYYTHLTPYRKEGCLVAIPAEKLEGEIFARIGEILRSSDALGNAVKAGLSNHPDEFAQIQKDIAEIERRLAKLDREQSKLVELLLEGGAFADKVKLRAAETNAGIAKLKADRLMLAARLKVSETPSDLPERLALVLAAIETFHGKAVMHWPPRIKKVLAKMFFGAGQTRFDRNGRHIKSNERGIFVKKVVDDGEEYWTYEARGLLGNFSGALTSVVAVYDRYQDENTGKGFSNEEIQTLAAELGAFENEIPRFTRSRVEGIRAK
jgi:site-specific DNA recombinase